MEGEDLEIGEVEGEERLCCTGFSRHEAGGGEDRLRICGLEVRAGNENPLSLSHLALLQSKGLVASDEHSLADL